MRRLISSDWQLADNSRDRYRTDFIVNELPKLIDKHQPDQLLFLGDLTENKDGHPASLVNEIVEIFYNLSKQCQVIFLEGNHDHLHIDHPYFRFIQKFDITWISKPTVLDNCLYLPHTRNHKEDWKDVDFSGHDFIFAHNIFDGVKSNGQKLSGIPTSIFPDSAFVLAGDVHDPQTVDCVTYVGSPFLVDFGDDFKPRMILLDGLNAKSIKVRGPQKRIIECEWSETPEYKFSPEMCSGDIIKVKVLLEMEHVANWDWIRNTVQHWCTERNLIVNTIQPIVSYMQGKRAESIKNSKKNDNQYLAAFVQRNGVDDETTHVGKEIINLVG